MLYEKLILTDCIFNLFKFVLKISLKLFKKLFKNCSNLYFEFV